MILMALISARLPSLINSHQNFETTTTMMASLKKLKEAIFIQKQTSLDFGPGISKQILE